MYNPLQTSQRYNICNTRTEKFEFLLKSMPFFCQSHKHLPPSFVCVYLSCHIFYLLLFYIFPRLLLLFFTFSPCMCLLPFFFRIIQITCDTFVILHPFTSSVCVTGFLLLTDFFFLLCAS